MKFEYIKWKDIITDSAWRSKKELEKPAVCHSAGILIDETKDFVRLSVGYSKDGGDEEWVGIISIPKGCIIKRERLHK